MDKDKENKKLGRMLLPLLFLILGIILTLMLLGDRLKEMVVGEDEVIELIPGGDEDPKHVAGGALEDMRSAQGEVGNDISEERGTGTGTGMDIGTGKSHAAGTTGKTLYARMVTEDMEQVWSTMTLVDIFDEEYEGTYKAGTENEITVENGMEDGENLIAPGTTKSYTFWIKNTGAVPMDYQVSFESRQNYDYGIPLEFRLKSGDMYIFGDGTDWMPWEDLNKAGEGRMLSPKSYARYTLEWRWKFRGDDEHDTYLGNKAVYQDLRQEVVIYTTGRASAGYENAYYLLSVQTGDDTRIGWYVILAAGSLAAILWYGFRVFWKKKDDEELGE